MLSSVHKKKAVPFKKRFFLIAAMIACGIFVSGCVGEKSPAGERVEKERRAASGPDVKQEVYSFRVEGFNKERKVEWELEGDSASVVAEKINISGLKGVYYGDEVTFTVFADKAVFDKENQDIELKENIVGNTSDGGKLVTTYAKWNAKTEKITTDRHVVVSRENISCAGKGLVTRPRLKKVQFAKDIEVTILPDKKIFCDGPFEIDHEKSVAIFNNNVRIVNPDSETFTDTLTVYLNPDTNEISRVVTEGNVRVVHRGDIEKIGDINF